MSRRSLDVTARQSTDEGMLVGGTVLDRGTQRGDLMIALHPLSAIGEVAPGNDLAQLLATALLAADIAAHEGDVLIVTQKVVSKAEDRYVDLCDIAPGAQAAELALTTRKDPRLVELILRESTAVLRAAPDVLIARHRLGHVMANAGIDRSNLGPANGDRVLLLPADPDASAERLRAGLGVLLGTAPAVIISDSFGRPWRRGVVNVAIGASGIPGLIDRRGELDRNGRRLEVTQVAVADLLASAAGLLMGEGAEGVPAVLVRGLEWQAANGRAADLVRPLAEDLFR